MEKSYDHISCDSILEKQKKDLRCSRFSVHDNSVSQTAQHISFIVSRVICIQTAPTVTKG